MIAIVFFLFGFVVSQANPFDHEYAVVIEATTGGTYGHCFRWNRRNEVGDSVTGMRVLGTTQVSEPLHHLGEIGQLNLLQNQIVPLLDYCQSLFPKAVLEFTPAFALFGGGVRALREPLQRNIQTVVYQSLFLSCFKVANETYNARILSPAEEGEYGWMGAGLVANQPLGAYQSVLYADLADAAAVSRTGATGNAQANFADGQVVELNVRTVSLVSRYSPVARFLRALDDNANLRQRFPCFPRDYERDVTVVTRSGQLRHYSVLGSGSADECRALLTTQVRDARRGSAARVPLATGTFLARGGLDDAIRAAQRVAGTAGQSSPTQLMEDADVLCNMHWTPLRGQAPINEPDAALSDSCTRAMWIAIVLRDVFQPQRGTRFTLETTSAIRQSAARGFVEEMSQVWPIGAPPRGVRCDDITVNLRNLELPRLVIYQCDCITFVNQQTDTVRYISSDALLRQVMPSFASEFLYPKNMVEDDPALYPQSEYRVCSDLDTPVGKYVYHGDVRGEATNFLIIRPQRNFDEGLP